MKLQKLFIFVFSISLLFFLGSAAGFSMVSTAEHLSTDNTTEFIATVKSIETKGTGSTEYGMIQTEEYSAKLNIYKIKELANINDFISLQAGQTISFRVEQAWLEQLEQANFIPIVSLKAADKEIFSLSRYNKCMDDQYFSIKITCAVLGLIFLLIAFYSARMLKNAHIFHRSKGNK